MKYGNIVISNSKKGIIPAIIRWATKSKFSHSLIIIPPIVGREMGLEAASSGIAGVPFDTQYRNNPDVSYEVYEFLVPTEIKDLGISESLNSLQKGYGFLELPWFLYRGILERIGIDIKHQNNWSQAGIICSEFCASFISFCTSMLGIGDLFRDYGLGSVQAEDVRQIARKNPDLFKLIEVKE